MEEQDEIIICDSCYHSAYVSSMTEIHFVVAKTDVCFRTEFWCQICMGTAGYPKEKKKMEQKSTPNSLLEELADNPNSWEAVPQNAMPTAHDKMFAYNPTTPDVADPDNVYIAQKIMGLVPCDGWSYMNFGSAGGAALMKTCNHENNKCYPTMTTGNMNGKIGGCPDFLKNIRACKDLIDFWRALGKTVAVTWDQVGVTARIESAVGQGPSMEEAVAMASIQFHKGTPA